MRQSQQTRLFCRRLCMATLVAGCFSLMGCFDDPAHVDLYLSDEVPLTVETWKSGPLTHFDATGAITDHGAVEGNAIVDLEDVPWSGFRILHGVSGDVRISVQATRSDREGILAEGTYTIVSGTGRYASVQGCGTFCARRGEDGSVTETFCGCCNNRFEPVGSAPPRTTPDPI